MKTVYAVQCNVAGASATASDDAWALVARWLERTRPDQGIEAALLLEPSGMIHLGSDEAVRWAAVSSGGRSVRRLEHEISPSPASPAGWMTRIWVCSDGDGTWLVLRAGPESPAGVVTSQNFDARRPGVVGDWIAQLHVHRDGLRLSDLAWNYGLGDRESLLGRMLDPARTLPIVAVSKAVVGDRHVALLDVHRLARQLGGNAHVVVLDRALSWEVTQELGQALSCFNGAVRVWWPGLTSQDDPARHPLLLPDRIEHNPDRALSQIVRRVWNAAVDAVGVPALERRLIAERQQAAVEQRMSELKTTTRDIDEVLAEWQQQLDDNVRLQELLNEAEIENEELRATLRKATIGADEQRPDDLPEVDTVEDAVRLAAAEATNVVYLPRAYEEARASNYPDPQQVLLDLRALHRVAEKWKDGNLGGDFRTAFAAEPVRFQPGIGQIAETKYRSDYEVTVGGRTVLMGPHLRRGTGPAMDILRIYWYVDDATKQLFVGHVGRKLRDQSNP